MAPQWPADLFILALIVGIPACGNDASRTNDNSSDGGADATSSTQTKDAATDSVSEGGSLVDTSIADASSGVRGTSVVHYIEDSKTVDVPEDLSSYVIEAFVARPATGFDVYPGVGKADGTFFIPSVPQGPYYLHVGYTATTGIYAATSARTLDMGYSVTGRPPAQTPAGTTLTLNIGNLAPWGSGNDLQLSCSNAGVLLWNLAPDAVSGAPSAGDTALNGLLYDYAQSRTPYVIQAAEGDRVILTQVVAGTSGASGTYYVADRALTTSAFTLSGGATTLSGAFVTTPRTETLGTTWRHTAFAQYVASTNPSAIFKGQLMVVDAVPGPLGHDARADGAYADLLIYDGAGNTSSDEPLSLNYGNPYPSTFGVFAQAQLGTTVSLALPMPDGGLATPYPSSGQIFVRDSVATFSGGEVKPVVSPVRNPMVNGNNAFDAVSGVGTSPTISWTAPSLGQPTMYQIGFTELTLNGNVTQIVSQTTRILRTRWTSVTVPPGILELGKHYLVKIKASTETTTELQIYEDLLSSYATAALGIVSP